VSEIKIDLSGMKMDKRCKVCVMQIWNMQLFLEIHELRIMKGFSNQAIQKFVNTEISEWNKKNPSNGQVFLSDTSVSNHFSKHVPAHHTLNAKIKEGLMQHPFAKEPFPPGVEKALAKMEETVEQANMDELTKFYKLVNRVAERFEQMDDNIAKSGKLSMEDVASFRALAELLGKLHKDMIQLRNQDKILTTALTSVLDTFSIGATEAVLKGIDSLITEFEPQFKDPIMAKVLSSKLSSLLGTSMIASAKTALQVVRQSMKTA
jgi:hypothetical protein